MTAKVALVTGPHGLSGGAVTERLSGSPDWTVYGCSRHPDTTGPWRPVTADLLDREATRRALAGRSDVTHLFFGAYIAKPQDIAAEAEENVAILENTLDALRAAGAPLRHVVLYHGGKAYGAHLGPFPTPARESMPRIEGPLLYHGQEDLVTERGREDGFTWTVFRPDWVGGATTRSPITIVLGLAVYATLCRRLGLPFRYPGSIERGNALTQSTDARLIGAASEWSCAAETARNQIFNLTNGDAYRWRDMWPRVGEMFGLETEESGPSLAAFMDEYGAVWGEVVAEHGLVTFDPVTAISWPTLDFGLTCGFDMLTSTVKIRRAGFHDCVDSEDMFREQFRELARRRIIPSGETLGGAG